MHVARRLQVYGEQGLVGVTNVANVMNMCFMLVARPHQISLCIPLIPERASASISASKGFVRFRSMRKKIGVAEAAEGVLEALLEGACLLACRPPLQILVAGAPISCGLNEWWVRGWGWICCSRATR